MNCLNAAMFTLRCVKRWKSQMCAAPSYACIFFNQPQQCWHSDKHIITCKYAVRFIHMCSVTLKNEECTFGMCNTFNATAYIRICAQKTRNNFYAKRKKSLRFFIGLRSHAQSIDRLKPNCRANVWNKNESNRRYGVRSHLTWLIRCMFRFLI